ncbi:undecaprenyl-diphosphatase [Campylobacter pinnipediorum subsp. pinnipediorum]|uniref:Undecaprenyl-diphosphatase n=1 Tax=Campylobacter pinnipediorum subsp. pinnipediorum TaxID=1660067 RepID=A0AAX0L9A9_9BACT|nr:undecaprenyl-diphosphate phosphatase [Campylobacter pinnipediorum]AQW85040.1 undecaprenyl pyrophosphate phosphatase [Campylobacter pinnipediorum subsp. pinnipediorum]OPA76427.1 undecaprenyl-diphosphatase [Campylobacter pinnipediorum subsp. pinnipediorum]
MDFVQTIVLALVQGFSEFLPISSSAHLILVPELLGWKDQGLVFDVAVHIGTLFAIVFYFRNMVFSALKDFFCSIKLKKNVGQSRLVWAVGFGTIPAGIIGLLIKDIVEDYARNGLIIAFTTIIFGIILFFADKKNGNKQESDIDIKIALVIGLAQAFALIPGVSRSGVTISMALLLGFSRVASANFSFLLSIPIIILAGAVKLLKINSSDVIVSDLLIGMFVSGISAYICVKLFISIISKISMLPFVVYRILLGCFLLFWFLF